MVRDSGAHHARRRRGDGPQQHRGLRNGRRASSRPPVVDHPGLGQYQSAQRTPQVQRAPTPPRGGQFDRDSRRGGASEGHPRVRHRRQCGWRQTGRYGPRRSRRLRSRLVRRQRRAVARGLFRTRYRLRDSHRRRKLDRPRGSPPALVSCRRAGNTECTPTRRADSSATWQSAGIRGRLAARAERMAPTEAPAPQQTLERELKFEVGPSFRLPKLPGEVLPRRTFMSVYHDTADHRLARHGVTVRRRTEKRTHRWQAKFPRGAARLELEVRGGADEPPDEVRRLLAVYTRGAALAPVATLLTRRSGVLVRDLRGPLAEVVLDSVSVFEGDHVAQRFREVEAELVGAGTEHDLQNLGALLRAGGARESDGRPKVFRVLGLEQPAAAAEPEATASPLEQIQA